VRDHAAANRAVRANRRHGFGVLDAQRTGVGDVWRETGAEGTGVPNAAPAPPESLMKSRRENDVVGAS